MSSGVGFGPAGPGKSEAPPFAVAGPSQVSMDALRSGAGSFTVSNVSGRPVRARVLVLPGAGADESWFTVQGESERALPVAGTTTVDVAVSVPEDVPAGSFSLVLGVALEESPEQVVSGPSATFEVAEPVKRAFPWWIVIVAAVAVALLVGGGLLIWNLTRPTSTSSPTPTSSPTSTSSPTPTSTPTPTVFHTGVFVAREGSVVDLETDESWRIDDFSRPKLSPDIFVYQGAGSGELVLLGYYETRLAVVNEPTYAACVAATDYDDDDVQEIVILPDQRELSLCVEFTNEGRRALLTSGGWIINRGGRGLIFRTTLWEAVS